MTEKNEHSSDASSSAQSRGTILNKAPKPAGLLPKSTQQFVILGVAVVMVLIMWLNRVFRSFLCGSSLKVFSDPLGAEAESCVETNDAHGERQVSDESSIQVPGS